MVSSGGTSTIEMVSSPMCSDEEKKSTERETPPPPTPSSNVAEYIYDGITKKGNPDARLGRRAVYLRGAWLAMQPSRSQSDWLANM